MIHELDEAIRRLLLAEGQFAPGSVVVSFDPPIPAWAATLAQPTLNCYLYALRENLELRSAEWLIERDSNGQASKRLAPHRYDLCYLITAWVPGQPADEHALLWRALAVLANHTTLPNEVLQGEAARQPYPIPAQVAQPVPLPDAAGLWRALGSPLRPAIHYTLTVALERPVTFSGPLVFTKRVEVLQQPGPSGQGEAIWQVAGVVRGGDSGAPIAGATLTWPELGRTVQTDAEGRYRLSNIPPGVYHVKISSGTRQVDKTLTVPAHQQEASPYDVEL
jgi:hypothetical protein